MSNLTAPSQPIPPLAAVFQFDPGNLEWENEFLAVLRVPLPGPPAKGSDGIGEANACTLANTAHQLDQSFKTLVGNTDPDADRKVRSLKRSIAKLKPALEAAKVRYVNVEGTVVTAQRKDIEVVGTPAEQADLKEPIVTFCEYPAVYYADRLVQRARCLIAVPLSKA